MDGQIVRLGGKPARLVQRMTVGGHHVGLAFDGSGDLWLVEQPDGADSWGGSRLPGSAWTSIVVGDAVVAAGLVPEGAVAVEIPTRDGIFRVVPRHGAWLASIRGDELPEDPKPWSTMRVLNASETVIDELPPLAKPVSRRVGRS